MDSNPPTSSNGPRKTILLVDDEETIHRALARTLRREPYELLHASDAAEAAAIVAQRPDVAAVVCDHYMPGTHGLELLMGIRRSHPAVRTVLLTAQADLQLVLSAINDGRIHRFFTKPWDGEQLRADLRDLLHEGSSPHEVPDAGRAAAADARVRRDMLPPQDALTGAFLIEPPAA